MAAADPGDHWLRRALAEGPAICKQMRMAREKPEKAVYTLLVSVGRRPGDGLPDGASGAALLCYAAGVSEEEAVRETVALLKAAELAPLDVTGYGTLKERIAQGHEIPPEEAELMERALKENTVIVAEMQPHYEESGGG